MQLRNDRYVRDARWKLTQAGDFFDMQDAPWQEIPVSADTTDAEVKAARDKLQAALDGMIAQDPNKDAATIPTPATQNEQPAKKKKKKKAP